jgi:putative MATE family efflux protein
MKSKNQSMLQGPLLGSIISYTVPIILTSILQLLFNAADLVVVGRFCGSISVAAVGATGSITALIVNLFIGLSVGAGVTVAHGVGSREDEVVHRTVHTAIPMALVSGAVLTVLGILLSEKLLTMMGTPENVLKLSTVYMQIYFAGITFTMIYNFAASILRAVGDTRSPLVFLTIAGVINVLLNLIFVTVLHMNVAGVALATAISQAFSAIAMVIVLMKRTDAAKLNLKKLRFYGEQMKKMIRIGLPAGIQSSLFSISNVMIQSSVNSFGDILMSGNAASQNIEGFLYVTMNSFHQTAVNFIGQNVGAKQYGRVKKIVWICLGCVLVTGFAMGTLICGFGEQLLSIYITDSAEAVAWGLVRMGIIARFYFLCGVMDVSTGALRGLGASVSPMVISVLGVCGVRIGWIATIFQIPRFHTPQCLYSSYIFSWTLTFLIQMYAFMKIYKKQTRNLLPEDLR